MNKIFLRMFSLLLASCVLTGCAGLLERSYSVLEPYADRYWDSSAEDTMRAESYQDLVNSILLLIEQRAAEGVIRCYDEAQSYQSALSARREVQRETMLGAYLVDSFQIDYENGASYSTLVCKITYREDAEDIETLMTLSDSQSLVDLLRLAVREEHEKLTAHFVYDTPREDVIAAVESLWQELCRSEMEEFGTLGGVPLPEPEPEVVDGEVEDVPEESPQDGEEIPPEEGEQLLSEEGEPGGVAEEPDGEAPEQPEEDPIAYPPCPWKIRFYPDKAAAELVEVLLRG